MIKAVFPDSNSIYIEVNGYKLAAAQGYKVKSSRNVNYIDEFGKENCVAIVPDKSRHFIELSSVYFCIDVNFPCVSFYELHDFNIVIVKPNSRVVYSGCEWTDISETANLTSSVIEKIGVAATKRLEILQ